MFTALNESLSKIFSTSIRTEKIPMDHKCDENGCSGSKYAGCTLICHRCLDAKYIECISEREEIAELLVELDIEPLTKPKQSTGNVYKEKVDTFFHSKSLLQFMCPSCEKEGSYSEIKKQYEEKIKTLKKSNTKLTREKNELEEKIKTIENTKTIESKSQCENCDNLSKEIGRLHGNNDSLKEKIDEEKTEINDQKLKINELTIANELLKAQVKSLEDRLNENEDENDDNINSDLTNKIEQLQDEIDKLNEQIGANKCNKCDGLENSFGSIGIYASEIHELLDLLDYNCKNFKKCIETNKHGIIDNLRSLKLCIPVWNRDNHVKGKGNKNTQDASSGLNPNSNIFHPTENISGANKNDKKVPLKKSKTKKDENAKKDENTKKDENGNFNAPNMNKSNAKKDENDNFNAPSTNKNNEKSETSLNIYVAPFPMDVTCNDIVDHIVKKTGIKNKRLLNVEMLMSTKENSKPKNYVSFKITAFSDDVYDMLLKKEVWGPNQSARPFRISQKSKSQKNINHSQNEKRYYGADGRNHGNNGYQRPNEYHQSNGYNNGQNGYFKKSYKPYIPRFGQQNQRYNNGQPSEFGYRYDKPYGGNQRGVQYVDQRYAQQQGVQMPRNNGAQYDRPQYAPRYQQNTQVPNNSDFLDQGPYDQNRLNPNNQYGTQMYRSQSRESFR